MVQWFSLEAIGTRYMSTCLIPRPERRRKEGLVSTACTCATIKICIHKREGTNNVLVLRWSGLWRFLLVFSASSTISKKLQDDCETATTTLPPAAHFPDILSKQVEASNRSILTSQTQSLGDNTQVYNRGSLFWLKYHLRSAYLLKDIQQRRINSSCNATIIEV